MAATMIAAAVLAGAWAPMRVDNRSLEVDMRYLTSGSNRGRSHLLRVCRIGVIVTAVAGPMPGASAGDGPSTSPEAPVPPHRGADWPMWGGSPDRNMVSTARNLPADWDVATKKNVRWVAELGTRTYGNLAVSGGKIFIGTNNGRPRNGDIEGDKCVLMCFAEADGGFLWQAVYDKLEPTQKYDWPDIGLCSTPCVTGDRVYFVSNRCELVCADTEGFRDGENDGPFTDEKLRGAHDADTVWSLDMRKELGVVPLFGSASAPLVAGDLVLILTGNGVDDETLEPAAPQAPSFLAVNRHTGSVVWQDASPGKDIVFGQWSSPAYGLVNREAQAVFPGGDGWLYGFEPTTGKPLWKFDCRAYPEPLPEGEKNDNMLVATPVMQEGKVFIAVGRDPEAGGGFGGLWAIDATKRGDITRSGLVWWLGGKEFERSGSTVAVADGLLYAVEVEGFLNCLDAATGKRLWREDIKGRAWASPLVADGKVYLPNEDGDVFVLRHGREKKLLATNAVHDSMYSTVVAANDTLYIATRERLYAIGGKHEKTASRPAADADSRRDGDWPMFRGNPRLTGVATSPLPADLQIRWKFNARDSVQSTAAIVNGAAYVGCDSGLLHAIDMAGGAETWKYDAKSPIRSSPCVAGGVAFFGDGNGILHAVDVRSGGGKWTLATEGEINSSPNYADGKVVFGSYDGYLYCVAAETGQLLWRTETEGRIHGAPTVTGDKILVAGCDEKFHVFRLSDGGVDAAIDMGSLSGASPAVVGPLAFVGTFKNQVIAVDFAAGRIAWTYQAPGEDSPFYASAAVSHDILAIGGRDGLVHGIDARNGKPRWTLSTRAKVDASPVIVGDRVVAASTDGCIYLAELASGKVIWQFDSGSSFVASPAVGEQTIVIGTEDGIVYCFGQRSGSSVTADRSPSGRVQP